LEEIGDMEQGIAATVSPVDVLRELATNFTQPLELIREAISNSYDAGANNIRITITRRNWEGNQRWIVNILDDGKGMVRKEQPPNPFTGNLDNFFGLGDSMRRRAHSHVSVGEKGLGIKVAFHSEHLTVTTWAGPGFPIYQATSRRPWASIFKGEMPECECQPLDDPQHSHEQPFTELEVVGFYDNDHSHFTADEVEDYIVWFTKWGSFEERIRHFLEGKEDQIQLHLGKLRPLPTGCVTLYAPGAPTPRTIPFGHRFPDTGTPKIKPNESLDAVLAQLQDLEYGDLVDSFDQAKRQHWRYITKVGLLKDVPDVTWQAIISIEGDLAKRSYNPYLRQRQRSDRFTYKAEERYGLWFCKDFFCVQQANPVAMQILEKEGQRTRFKILLNCQDFRLNADRTRVAAHDAEILRGIEEVARQLVTEMIDDNSWVWTKIIEEAAEVRTSEKQDKLQLKERTAEALKKPFIQIEEAVIGRVPATEAETALLLQTLAVSYPKQFAFFQPLDWRTDKGIDCLVHSEEPGEQCRFVEFKKDLRAGQFNHTFDSLHYVVCWEVKASEESTLQDPANKKMMLRRWSTADYDLPHRAPWTLEGNQRTVKVYALRDILQEKLGAQFPKP
jgi:hypothetical protein